MNENVGEGPVKPSVYGADETAVRIHESVKPYLADIDEVRQHPNNPNSGDVDSIAESIMANGFYNPIVVQRSTGYILAGNHRYAAMLSLGQHQIPVAYIDVDDERALRVLLADNRTAELAIRDLHDVQALLKQLEETDQGLAGTAYDEEALDEIKRLNQIADHAGFEKLHNAIEDSQGHKNTIVLYGWSSEAGATDFKPEEIDGVLDDLRESGYRAVEGS